MGTKNVQSNFTDENLNPCFDEGRLTKKCLNENFYNAEKCTFYFENYRNCLKFWEKVKSLRRKHNIHPIVPDREERVKITQEREKGNCIYRAS